MILGSILRSYNHKALAAIFCMVVLREFAVLLKVISALSLRGRVDESGKLKNLTFGLHLVVIKDKLEHTI